jgi:Flp pilus assembly protein TadD
MREQRSAKNMCPRSARNQLAAGGARLAASASLLAFALGLVGCGSAPSSQSGEQSAASSTAAPSVKSQRKRSGAPDEAATVPVVEAPLPPEAVQQFDAAVVHMNAGDQAAAEQAFRSIADTYPAYSGALVNLGIMQSKAGRLEEAEKTFRSALERNAANAAALNQLGIVYRKLGRFQDAEQAYQQALQVDPNYANAYLNLGVLCDLYLQQPERALQAYERYLELSPSPDARVNAWVSELKKRIGAEPRAARSE